MASNVPTKTLPKEPTAAVSDLDSAVEVLRENEEKFRIAFDNAPLGMSIIRADGQYLEVNPTLCKMFGYSKEEMLSGTINRLTHPDDIERGNRWIKKMISGDYSEPEFEKRYFHKDGHIVWGLVRAQWVRNEDGSPRLSIVHILDITERKRAEQAIMARERQLQEAHDIAQMGHWQLDLSSGLMLWGRFVYRILEIDPTTQVPSPELFLSRVHAEDRAQVEHAHRRAVDDSQQGDLTVRLLFADQRIKHVRWICRPEFDASGSTGSTRYLSGILQDVTIMREAEEERTRLKAQLDQAQRMESIGYLAGGIAHDFNNLLTAIGGNASLALQEANAQGSLAEALTAILRSVESAADLTRQLLTFSRKQVILPRVLNLNQVIEHLAPILRRLLGEDLHFETLLEAELGHVRMDVAQAEQVLINLAVNARDAMKDGGELTLETKNVQLDEDFCRRHGPLQPGPCVMLKVSDSGRGMSEATRQRLFEPFFTTKEQGHGTGLGLAIVYGAVKQNNGHIEVHSQEGHGATFTIYLPRVDEPAEPHRAKPVMPATRGRETIVLVEDDAMVRAIALRVLIRQGYVVHAYPDGVSALDGVRALDGPLDLLITDVIMPGMNGRILSEQLKVLRPGVKVLFTSGYTHNVIARHGVLEAGIQFLGKPYSVDLLAARVRELLG